MIVLKDIGKHHKGAVGHIQAITDISLTIHKGEMCAIVGASGSGKSTLLNIVGLLDRPTVGAYLFNGFDVTAANNDDLADIRCIQIGFIFQAFNLLPHLSALDNVALPLLYRGKTRGEGRLLACDALEKVGLGARMTHRPRELSGGQQQRVAIARALIGNPVLLLADEPTGNLDSRASQDVMNYLIELNESSNMTIVVVTHDPAIAARCHRQICVMDGHIKSDSSRSLAVGLH